MASTEQRAKELAKALEVAESGSDLELQILAAALAACAREARNEALEEAAHLCERDLTNEEDAEWNAFEGGFELWLAKRLRGRKSK